MTVIAWDGKTLAADKLICFGATNGTVTKIQRFGDCLVGLAGDFAIGTELLEWFKAGADPDNYPQSNRSFESGASLILIKPDKTVWKYENAPYPFKLEGDFFAFGSGDESALVAMEAGCDAKRAVEITCKYNTGCGNGVDTLKLL